VRSNFLILLEHPCHHEQTPWLWIYISVFGDWMISFIASTNHCTFSSFGHCEVFSEQWLFFSLPCAVSCVLQTANVRVPLPANRPSGIGGTMPSTSTVSNWTYFSFLVENATKNLGYFVSNAY
jgi:hypothetical protein